MQAWFCKRGLNDHVVGCWLTTVELVIIWAAGSFYAGNVAFEGTASLGTV